MAADAREPPSSGPAVPVQAHALHRGLALRIGIAAALFAIVAVALIASKRGGSNSDANAPVSATAPPLPIAQSPAPSARVAEQDPATAAAPAIEPSESRPTASPIPAAKGEKAGEEVAAAPAAPAPSGSAQAPEPIGKATPESRDAPPGALKPETRSAVASASRAEAPERSPPAKAEPEPSASQAARTQASDTPARGPRLQAGVFAQASNAQALKAKLEGHGFPVHIESRLHAGQSRVHVGPFKDREEAELAREKLQAMGVTTVLIEQ